MTPLAELTARVNAGIDLSSSEIQSAATALAGTSEPDAAKEAPRGLRVASLS